MPNERVPYNVIYHVATINHWKDVVREQMALLTTNQGWALLTVSIGADADGLAREAAELIRGFVTSAATQFYRFPLSMYEHGAMDLVDQVAGRGQGGPVLYFHTKAVSYCPPDTFSEDWRRYVNRLVAEADRWAEFLVASEFDACGPLMVLDPAHGFEYFAGNFWMAKAEYLKGLGPYRDFAQAGAGGKRPGDRHLAELGVNRARRMGGYAIDGTSLTMGSLRDLERRLGRQSADPPAGQNE